MAVVEETTITPQLFLGLRDELEKAVRAGEQEGADAVVARLSESTARAVAAREVEEIVDLRACIARLRRRIEQLTSEIEPARRVVDQLNTLGRVLEGGRTAAVMREVAREREDEVLLLRDRIVQVLKEGPMRPRELAARFDCDPSQVSRAVRELQREGLVEEMPPLARTSDKRAHWYGLSQEHLPEVVTVGVSPLGGKAAVEIEVTGIAAEALAGVALYLRSGHVSVFDHDGHRALPQLRRSFTHALESEDRH